MIGEDHLLNLTQKQFNSRTIDKWFLGRFWKENKSFTKPRSCFISQILSSFHSKAKVFKITP